MVMTSDFGYMINWLTMMTAIATGAKYLIMK